MLLFLLPASSGFRHPASRTRSVARPNISIPISNASARILVRTHLSAVLAVGKTVSLASWPGISEANLQLLTPPREFGAFICLSTKSALRLSIRIFLTQRAVSAQNCQSRFLNASEKSGVALVIRQNNFVGPGAGNAAIVRNGNRNCFG